MKITFVEPKAPFLNVYSHVNMPRLGILILGTSLKEKGYEVEIQIEEMGDLKLNKLHEADLVGISILTSTAPAGYKLAQQLMESGKTVVIGGPHATYMPEEALQYADFVVRGEADETIVSFVEAVRNKSGFDKISGLSFWSGGKMIHNPDVPYCQNIDTFSYPNFNLIVNWKKQMQVTPVITARGCPFDCEFCSVSSMFGRLYRYRSAEKVLEELKRHRDLIKENKIKNSSDAVFFYDDNFTVNRKRTKELLRMMIAEKLTPRWIAQASVDVAKDEELLFLLKESRCYSLCIGFESINSETLKAYNKKQTVEKISDAIDKLHRFDIKIHGMFVLGADSDDKKVVRETVRFVKKNSMEFAQFLILTPLPGTRTFRNLNGQGRIISRDWSLYDGHHVVFTPKNFAPLDLQRAVFKIILNFYSYPYTIKRILLGFRFKNLKPSVIEIYLRIIGRRTAKKWFKERKEWIKLLSSAS